jgi:hypothetical protein
MMTFRHKLLLALAALSGASNAQCDDIILRLTPSEDAAIIAKIDASTSAAQTARPVLEAQKARQGWKWLEHTTTLDGYIPTSSLSKNFEIAANTLVRTAPSNDAHVLTSTQSNDRFTVTASNDQWSTVRFRKAVPVYFREHSLPTYTANQVPGPAVPKRPNIDPNAPVAHMDPDALAPENVKWSAAPIGTPDAVLPQRPQLEPGKPSSIMIGTPQVEASELPRSPELKADSLIRNLTGLLVREISNTGPRQPIRLKSPSGQRIAYVDMSHVFISDLRPFLGNSVHIIGEVRPLVPGSADLIIQARTIRIAE